MIVNAWQPMSTAPKDGTEILGYLGGASFKTTDFHDRFQVLWWSNSYSVFGQGGCWTNGLSTLGSDFDVTLWCELPTYSQRMSNHIGDTTETMGGK